MKAIIGLGNPGKEYEKTRHNAGFLCVDFLRQASDLAAFAADKRMSAEISSGIIGGERVMLVKPQTLMNNSGTAVQALLRFYKLSPADIAIIHDDLDIAPGTYKTTSSSRAAGHNGVQDIIERLGTHDFFRIRLGIGRPAETAGACISPHSFVLQSFSEEELKSRPFLKVKEILRSSHNPPNKTALIGAVLL
jgi:PTH1 family peptidyl-tRNA hydrolase